MSAVDLKLGGPAVTILVQAAQGSFSLRLLSDPTLTRDPACALRTAMRARRRASPLPGALRLF